MKKNESTATRAKQERAHIRSAIYVTSYGTCVVCMLAGSVWHTHTRSTNGFPN